MNTIEVTVTTRTPKLLALTQALSPAGRADLYAAGGATAWALARRHLRAYARTHHATATRLKAQPTGNLEEAASTMRHTATHTGATITIHGSGIGRARHPLTILPREKKALTIPIHAIAYGRRVAEVARTHPIFRPKAKGGKPANYLAANIDGQLTPLYILVRRAVVPQDSTMLPTPRTLTQSFIKGIVNRIAQIRKAHAEAQETTP